MDLHTQPLIILTGQTATGKTSFALEAARKISGEIISADSRQAYKYLDVISGKDKGDSVFVHVTNLGEFDIGYYTTHGTRVWLYDCLQPRSYFSSYDWVLCARWVLSYLSKENTTPILVGGTYFYLKALVDGLVESAQPNWQLRSELEKLPVPILQEKVRQIDVHVFAQMNRSDRQNRRRLIRKIEQLRAETPIGKSVEKLQGYNTQWFALLHATTEDLHNAINERVRARLQEGALAEVELLMQMGFSHTAPGMNTIGYQQLTQHLTSATSLAHACSEWIIKERQYAKRQKTAIIKDERIQLFSPHECAVSLLVDMVK